LYLHFLSCVYQVQPDDIHVLAWQSVPIFMKTVRKFYILYHRHCHIRLSHLKKNLTIEGQPANMKGLDITLPRQYKSPTETPVSNMYDWQGSKVKSCNFSSSEVLTVVLLKMQVFWDDVVSHSKDSIPQVTLAILWHAWKFFQYTIPVTELMLLEVHTRFMEDWKYNFYQLPWETGYW